MTDHADELDKRYKVCKATGSKFAYVIDTHGGGVVRRFDILKPGGWEQADKMRDRLNAEGDAQ